MSLCLNMIVKNESHIIEQTLENICCYFPLTYWVISDTGSSDDTIAIIENFFDVRSYNSEHYFDKVSAENFHELLLVCDNIGKINIEEFLYENFKDINVFLFSLRKTHSIYNKESYSSIELDNEIDKSFYSNVCSPFFKFLTEHKLHKIIEILDEDLINKVIKNDKTGDLNDFLKTFSYLKINNKLSSSKKIKQIKI